MREVRIHAMLYVSAVGMYGVQWNDLVAVAQSLVKSLANVVCRDDVKN